jgi:arylsulfatase A-like enzyme
LPILGLALGLGCSPAVDPVAPDLEVAYRYIEEEPAELLDPTVVDDDGAIFTWAPESPAALRRWDPAESGLPAGLRLAARDAMEEGGVLTFDREAKIDTSSVDAILVRARGARRVTLLWASRGETFSAGRQIDAAAESIDASGLRSYLLPLFDHDEWQGSVGRLRLMLFHRASPAELLEIQGLALSVRSPRPLKVNLGREVRNAWVASPGQTIDRQLRIPAEAELRFAYGVRWTRAPLRLQVSVQAPQGRRIVFDEVVSLLEDGDGASGRPPDRWHRAVVDLSEFAGSTVGLRLGVDPTQELGRQAGMAFWGHPEIVRPASAALRPNIVLVSIDTLRADRLSLYGNPRPTSPHLDAWAARSGVVFRNAVAAAPWTLPSHASMLSGLDAHRHGFNDMKAAIADDLLLASEILRQNGYATLAAVGGGPLHPIYRFTQGFDVYAHWLDRGHRTSSADEELETHMNRVLEWLQPRRRRPFFLFFHTFEVHPPHRPREPHFSRFSRLDGDLGISLARIDRGSRPPFLGTAAGGAELMLVGDETEGGTVPLPPELASLPFDMYDSRVAFMDQQLSRLLSRLQEPDLERSTIVVLTSDHGELMGEHGLAGHAYLHEKNLLVPLVIAAPDGLGAGRTVDEQVRGVDLLPTILDLAGLPSPGGLDGVSLVPAMRGRSGEVPPAAWSFSARNQGVSVRWRNRLKYIFQDAAWAPLYGHEALYDLTQDPDEANDLAKTSQEAKRMRERIRQRIERDARGLWARFENSGPVPLSGALRGAMIGRDWVRSVDLRCACVSRPGPEEAEFEIPPGRRFTLRLTAARASEIHLTLALTGEDAVFAGAIDPEAIAGPEAVVFTGSSWERGPPPPAPRIGITFWWRHKRQAAEGSPLDDHEVLRELRALGYVD